MNTYHHLFFDLDRTIWDLDANSNQVLTSLYEHYSLKERGVTSPEKFIQVFTAISDQLWEEYGLGKIDKSTLRKIRFPKALKHWEIENEQLAENISSQYIAETPLRKQLLPNALETLEYLKRNYQIHIITNGFEDTQHKKINSSGIRDYFTHIITSESCGYTKPSKEIFEYAVRLAGTREEHSLMIGDNYEIDIVGARNAGMHQVFFSSNPLTPLVEATHIISNLSELKNIL